jgi:type II secretory pathway pseudopilin PulG
VDLLTVITMIAILMALLFPALAMALETMRKRKAMQNGLDIVLHAHDV